MTSQYHETAVVELKHLYTLRNEEAIVEFLDERPNLYDFLREAQPILHSYFPAEALALEIIYDPEAEDDKVLFISIVTSMEVDEVAPIFNQLRQNWWLKQLGQFRGKLGMDVEFL